MSSEKATYAGEVSGRTRRDRAGAARPVTVAVAVGAGVLVVAALVFLAHEVNYVRGNGDQLQNKLAKANDQILALKDRTLAMEIKQDAAARDKEEMTALKTELQQEKADGASLRERLAVLETKFQLGHAEEHNFENFREDGKPNQADGVPEHNATLRRYRRSDNSVTTPASFVVLKGRPDETGGTAVMVLPVRRVLPGLPARLVDVEGVEDNPAHSSRALQYHWVWRAALFLMATLLHLVRTRVVPSAKLVSIPWKTARQARVDGAEPGVLDRRTTNNGYRLTWEQRLVWLELSPRIYRCQLVSTGRDNPGGKWRLFRPMDPALLPHPVGDYS
uniref:Uncharacterized protein n=1 Tax=Branchiostoma floridae TaxID=7739 RepID=C3Y5X9_BRAFL|eukprot:XP_002608366.1 hypothetical protein BRAFLDRAFT_91325 [Branchiostoma floridae]